jgi:hypothetical protein
MNGSRIYLMEPDNTEDLFKKVVEIFISIGAFMFVFLN